MAGARSTRSTRGTPARRTFVWTADPGVKHEGNAPRTRGIALWEDKVIANLPDGRVIAINRDNGEIVWDKKIAGKNEFGGQEKFLTAPLVADGKVIIQNGAGDAGTRGWVAGLDVKDGKELWRFYTVPKPGDPGSESWKDDHNAWKTGGGGIWQTGSFDPATHLYIVGTGNPYPIYDPQFRPGDNLYTNSVIALNVETGKLAWYFQYTPNDSWDFDEIGVHMLYDAKIDGATRKVVGHYARNGFFYTLDRTNGQFIKSEKYVNDLNWTKGIDQKTGKPVEYSPKLDVQFYNQEARALRGDGMKRTCPTWHGGVAHQPLAYNPVKGIAYGVGTEGCFSQNGAAVGVLSKDGGVDPKTSQPRKYTQRPLLRRGHGVRRREPQGDGEGRDRHRDPIRRDGHGRRPGLHGPAGRLDRRLQRRDARGTLALQRRDAAQGRAGHLRDRAEAVSRRADERPAPAPGELGQAPELELPVRFCVELDRL